MRGIVVLLYILTLIHKIVYNNVSPVQQAQCPLSPFLLYIAIGYFEIYTVGREIFVVKYFSSIPQATKIKHAKMFPCRII